MSAIHYTPPLRLEIRNKSEDGAAPWFTFGLAQTDGQAADLLRRSRVQSDCETRIMPNDALGTPPAPVFVDSEETKLLLVQLGTENQSLRRELNAANARLEKMNKEKIKAAAPAVDALAGETPLPFGPGDLLRDVHTGVVVKVTEINPPHPVTGNKRPGFAWENTTTKPGDKDHTGYCPLGSVGAFVRPGEKLEEQAPPDVKPASAPETFTASGGAAAVVENPVRSSAPIPAPAAMREVPVNRVRTRPAAKPHAHAAKPAKPLAAAARAKRKSRK